MAAKTEAFDKYYKRYEEWFKRNEYVYKSELKAVNYFIPEDKKGIEIGVGSGKFAAPLGVEVGVEPSKKMRRIAKKRGIEVYKGRGEYLEFDDNSFDYALMVTTICFLEDVERSFQEVRRVLKDNGEFIIAFVDKDTFLGKEYLSKKDENVFYKDAVFYSTKEVVTFLEKTSFKNIEFVQTIFKKITDIDEVQDFKKGYGEGGFVVIKAEI